MDSEGVDDIVRSDEVDIEKSTDIEHTGYDEPK